MMRAALVAQSFKEQMRVIDIHRHGARRQYRHANRGAAQRLPPIRRRQTGQARNRVVGNIGATILGGAQDVFSVQRFNVVQFVAEAGAEIIKAVLIVVRVSCVQVDKGFGTHLFQQGADGVSGRFIERLREFKL
jgi:hypothetical protein